MRLGVVKEKGLVLALTKAQHTGYGLTLSMKALFVFLVNARPLNVPVYSLKKKRQEKREDGKFCLFRGYLLSCLATIRTKIARTQKALQACSYPGFVY